MLGYILEKASETSYGDYLREHIFDPLAGCIIQGTIATENRLRAADRVILFILHQNGRDMPAEKFE